jgi:hypothetical protein
MRRGPNTPRLLRIELVMSRLSRISVCPACHDSYQGTHLCVPQRSRNQCAFRRWRTRSHDRSGPPASCFVPPSPALSSRAEQDRLENDPAQSKDPVLAGSDHRAKRSSLQELQALAFVVRTPREAGSRVPHFSRAFCARSGAFWHEPLPHTIGSCVTLQGRLHSC